MRCVKDREGKKLHLRLVRLEQAEQGGRVRG